MSFERSETPLSLADMLSQNSAGTAFSLLLLTDSPTTNQISRSFSIFLLHLASHILTALRTMVSWVDITRTITLLTVVGEATLLEGVVELGAEREVG